MFAIYLRGATAGKLSFQIYNAGVTGRALTVDDMPTVAEFKNTAQILFTINVENIPGSTEYRLDGTDDRVTYINQDFVGQNGYIHIPTGYFIGAQQVGVAEPGAFYYGGSDALGFTYADSSTGTFKIAVGNSANIGVGFALVANGTKIETVYNFDDHIYQTEDIVTTEFKEATETIETMAGAAGTQGAYVIPDISFMNGRYMTGFGCVSIQGVEHHFFVGTVSNNASLSGTITNITPLFTIGANNDGYSSSGSGSDTNIVYKFDGTDARITYLNQDLYDSENKGFLWDSTKVLISDTRTKYSSNKAFFYQSSVGTTDYWNNVWSVTVNDETHVGTLMTRYQAGLHFMPYVTETVHTTVETYKSKIIEDLVKRENSPLKGKYLSMIGDSISTFEGWSNVAPAATGSGKCYYPKPFLTDVRQTYWMKLCERTGMKLLVNNSYTGSRCANKGNGPVVATGANDRCKQLHKNGINPDYILINIGTNDFDGMDGSNETMGTWNGRGENYPANPDSQSPTSFREAYAVMLHRLRKNYPLAKIFCCTVPCGDNKGGGYDEFNGAGYNLVEFNDAIREIATAYGAHIVELATSGLDYWTLSTLYGDYDGNPTGVTTYKLHPSEAGMERYYEIIRSAMENEDSSNVSCPRSSALMKSTATAVANATDTSDVVTQLNALLSALRTRGVIAAS